MSQYNKNNNNINKLKKIKLEYFSKKCKWLHYNNLVYTTEFASFINVFME